MTDQDTTYADKPLTEAQAEHRARFDMVPVGQGGIAPQTFAQAIDYAKMMATANGAVGNHLIRNVGACLALMEIAHQFKMPAYAVARQTYFVNGRIAFMGQFFHTVIEQHAPLKKGPNGRKLQWRYEGQGDTLKIIVFATFEDATVPVEYESPMFKDLKVKNSPLWQTEPKRQFIYFGVRGWQTEWWPEGLLSAMTGDEAAALPPMRDVTPPERVGSDLRDRLAAHNADQDGERAGFSPGFTEGHFEPERDETTMRNDAAIDAGLQAATTTEPPGAVDNGNGALSDDSGAEQADPKPAAKAKPAKAPKPPKPPKKLDDWKGYAETMIEQGTDPKALRDWWSGEMKLRNDLGVTSELRDPVFEALQNKLGELEKE